MSLSLSTIFGVVPDEISEWKPEIAPQAMVMNTNGKSGPGMMGPPPDTYCVIAGICIVGFTRMTPTTRIRMVPIFMYVLRYARGVNNIQTGMTDAANP